MTQHAYAKPTWAELQSQIRRAPEHFDGGSRSRMGGVRGDPSQLSQQALPVYRAELVQSDLSVFPRNRIGTLVAYGRITVVMGAIMTVRRYWFISSGETTRQGRVCWISTPWVGSRLTSQISSRRAGRATTAIHCERTRSAPLPPAEVRHGWRDQPHGMLSPSLGATGDPEK